MDTTVITNVTAVFRLAGIDFEDQQEIRCLQIALAKIVAVLMRLVG